MGSKKKVTAPLNDGEFHINEKVVKVEPFVIDFGFDETWFLLFTECGAPFGYGKNGRILIADSENTTRDFAGGIFWINEGGVKKIQSVYLDPEFRKGLVMPRLVEIARSNEINTITGPFSPSGKSFANRYRFNVEQGVNEVAEPIEPLKKVTRKTIKKDPGTWKERSVVEFKFQTHLGNIVKVHFDKIDNDEDAYDVMFYVNDTQYDDASVTSSRDVEILGNVLWLIKNKSDQMGIKKLKFIAQSGKGDIKNIRNLDFNKYKNIFNHSFDKLKSDLNNYTPTMVQPNVELYKKLNRPVPPPRPGVDKNLFAKIIASLEQCIEYGTGLDEVLNNNYHHFENLKNFGIDTTDFLKSCKDLVNAIESNSPHGWNRVLNRREVIWEKLVRRYFSDWSFSKYGSKFELVRDLQ